MKTVTFKVGDSVVCVNPGSSTNPLLTEGCLYTIVGVRDDENNCCPVCESVCKTVRVQSDIGQLSNFCPSRFRLAARIVDIPGLGKIALKPREK